MTAALMREFRDLDVAEDALQDAVVTALESWPTAGIPDRPGAWLHVTARRKALDRLRRNATLAAKLAQLAPDEPSAPMETSHDELRLLFMCCHPALNTEAQVALTLRSLCGLTTREIARAFLLPEATLAQRLVRAKKKIRVAGIPFALPAEHVFPDRLAAVLAIVYLVFNEGYASTSGDALIRSELCTEAIRLARMLLRLMPDEPEVRGLLALLLFTDARRAARIDDRGQLVLLEDQDRTFWNRHAIDEGLRLLPSTPMPGRYELQAAIGREHAVAATAAQTDWRRIAALYDELVQVTGSPVVELNRAVAVAMAEGPAAGLARIDRIDALNGYHHLHAARADLLRRLGRRDEARAAYQRALELTDNEVERAFLRKRLDSLEANGAGAEHGDRALGG